MTKVGVVIPVRNGAAFLAEALASVRAQGWPGVDVVVVDDGSSDGSGEVARAGGARVVRLEGEGAGPARNRGMEEVCGECLAFLDADDRWTEGSLAARMDAFRADEGLGLVYGRVREFSAHPGAALRPETAAPIPSAVVIRRDAFERCGRFAARFAGADAVEGYARVVDAGSGCGGGRRGVRAARACGVQGAAGAGGVPEGDPGGAGAAAGGPQAVRRGLPEPPEGAVALCAPPTETRWRGTCGGPGEISRTWTRPRSRCSRRCTRGCAAPGPWGRTTGKAGIYRWSWVRNQVAIRAAALAIGTLGGAGIPVLGLKGLPLLVLYHGDLGARLMFDVDLLIPEERVLEAWDLLLADGWMAEVPRPPARVVPCLHAVAFARPAGGMIDLHWKPLPFDGPRGEWDALRQRALPADFGGRPAFVPEATDLALLALLHAMRPDAHAGLRWALDLAVMNRKSPLDGAALEARAAAWGFGAPVRAALERLRALLGIVPAGALAGGAPRRPRRRPG